MAQRGLLLPASNADAASLLPVSIETHTVLPQAKRSSNPALSEGSIDVEFAGGVRVRVQGNVDAMVLERVFKALSRR